MSARCRDNPTRRSPRVVLSAIAALAMLYLGGCPIADTPLLEWVRLAHLPVVPVPVAYYPFKGNANDESGNGNHGTVFGATLTADRFGNPAAAYDFNGTSGYIDVPDATELNPAQAISVVAWFKLRSFSTMFPPIAKKAGQGSTQSYGYALECHPDPGGSLGPYVGPAVWLGADLSTGLGGSEWCSISLNTWHFVAGVYDGSSFKLYIDGQLRSSLPTTGTILPSPNNLNIGRDPSNTSRLFDGIIDEVYIYDSAISETEIQKLFLR
jgi:hypothetical protein